MLALALGALALAGCRPRPAPAWQGYLEGEFVHLDDVVIDVVVFTTGEVDRAIDGDRQAPPTGVVGVLIRRNIIVILLSVELMLNATNINFVAFSEYFHNVGGQVFVFFALTVAAAEAATLAYLEWLERTGQASRTDTRWRA